METSTRQSLKKTKDNLSSPVEMPVIFLPTIRFNIALAVAVQMELGFA